MQYTSHFGLMLPEGADTVNLLTQMNPNTSDIDNAMYANKQASIGSATEVTSGTVHAITRANTDSNYFRFTATSNWAAGDTMEVDGVVCSVYLSDGSAPAYGAYVINSEVLALLSGTRVTILTSGAKTTSLPASAITYNGGTAEDGLDQALAKDYVSVTGDGVKTVSQMLDQLFNLIDFSKLTTRSQISIADDLFDIQQTGANPRFSRTLLDLAQNRVLVTEVTPKATNSTYIYSTSINGLSNVSDGSSIVFGNGTSYKLIY